MRPVDRQSSYSARVKVAGVNLWRENIRGFRAFRPVEGGSLCESQLNAIKEAHEAGQPVWIEVELSNPWPDWYGSWEEFDRPEVDWAAAGPLFALLGVKLPEAVTPGNGQLATEVLRILPFVYELGAARAFAEILAPCKSERARTFPAAGFEASRAHTPADQSFPGGNERFRFRAVRLNVASADNLVFTLRQHRLVGRASELTIQVKGGGTGPPPLQVPVRYLPNARRVEANDLVDGIALYLGATCEWIAEGVENNLAEVERDFFDEIIEKGATQLAREGEASGPLEAAFKELHELGDVMRKVERELAMILQRAPVGGVGSRGLEATAAVEPRYEAALKKVESLHTQLRLAGETMASAVTTQQFVLAEKHRRIAEEQRFEGEKLQRAGTLLASVVLVPGLVAAVYGANVPVPGSDNAQGVTAMVLFMLGGGLSTWGLITFFSDRVRGETTDAEAAAQPPHRRGYERWFERPSLRAVSERPSLRAVFGAAVTAFILALYNFVDQLSDAPSRSRTAQLAERLKWDDAGSLVGSLFLVAVIGVVVGWMAPKLHGGRSAERGGSGTGESAGGET